MILAQLLAATAIAVQAASGTTAQPGETEISARDAQAMKSHCGLRKFETFADIPGADGKVKRKRLTLCAPDSDSREAWISKLQKASAAVEANPQIPQEQKAKLVADFQAEIARQNLRPVKGGLVALVPPAQVAPPQAVPLPQAAPAPTPAPMAQLPIATPIAAAPLKPADLPAYAPPAGAPKRIALVARCVAPGASKSQACGEMAPNERLEIRAEADVSSPMTLLFRQTGRGLISASDKEAEVELAGNGLRKGETALVRVPKKVCPGFRSKFEVEVRTKDQKANQSPFVLGPFEMRCPS